MTSRRRASLASLPAQALHKALSASGLQAGLCIVYHEVAETVRTGAATPGIPLGTFREHLEFLTSTFLMVRSRDLLDAARQRGRHDKFPLALTFDDDLNSHSAAVLPMLGERAPATFFLSGRSLRELPPPWWVLLDGVATDTDLAAIASMVDLPTDAGLRAIAGRIEGLDEDRLVRVESALLEVSDEDPRSQLGAAQIETLAHAGNEIGFHTLEHRRLDLRREPDVARAMEDGRRDLVEALAGRQITSIAYPHGRATEETARLAAYAGFEVGFVTAAAAITPTSPELLLPRIPADDISTAELPSVLAVALLRARLRSQGR